MVKTSPGETGNVLTVISSGLNDRADDMLAAVCRASADAIVVLDHDGAIRHSNPSAERLMGRLRSGLVGRHVAEVVHPDDHHVMLDRLAATEVDLDVAAADGTCLRVLNDERGWLRVRLVGVAALSDIGLVATLRPIDDATADGGGGHDRVIRATERWDPDVVAGEIRAGLAAGELELHYQPIRDVRSGRIAGFEGLLRWHHPTRGGLTASDFLPAVEGTEVMVAIGESVLAEGCAQLAYWERRFGSHAPTLAINVSARQLREGSFARRVVETLEREGVHPGQLCIELTETHALEREPLAVAEIEHMRRAGLLIALDDFGTGYSSLHHLQQIGADVLKIDRAFIRHVGVDDGATAIVRAAIELGAAFGMTTVAEGVTTIEQHRLLLSMGCDRVQGFLVAPALPPDLAESMLIAERPGDPPVGTIDVERHLRARRVFGELSRIDEDYRPSDDEVAVVCGIPSQDARRELAVHLSSRRNLPAPRRTARVPETTS